MKRIWESAGLSGLLKRREAEALLYARGLEPVLVASAPSAGQQTESLQDPALFDGDGLYADEDETTGFARESGTVWEEVKWPSRDEDAPDYQHISDRSLAGKTFEFDGRALELLITANSFEPTREHGRIIFALRGAELVTSLTVPEVMMRQQDRPALTLRDCRPNHKDFRCVIGVYDLTTGRMSGFASSTVPNRGAVAGYYANKQAGNMMPGGCYRFTVNWHLVSYADRKIPGCLTENGRQKCVMRSINNLSYDLEDVWENHKLHGDNLHPAKSSQSAKFSSLGCLVVSGNYDSTGTDREHGTHTGEWALFRKALGLTKPGTGDHGREYDVVLITGLEAAIATNLVKSGADSNAATVGEQLGRLRYGSKGERAKRLEAGLGLPPSGTVGPKVLKAWTERQKRDFAGKSVAAYSPESERHYKFGVFDPLPVAVASSSVNTSIQRESLGGTSGAQLEQLYYEIGLHAEASRRHPSSNTSSLESLSGSNLEAINLEFGFANIKAYGLQLVQIAERKLQESICGNPLASVGGRDNVRGQVNAAAQKGIGELRRYLSAALITILPVVPPSLSEKVIDALFERILRPAVGGVGDVVVNKMDLSAEWLCQRWCERLGTPFAETPASAQADDPVAPGTAATGLQLAKSGIDIQPIVVAAAAAPVPIQSASIQSASVQSGAPVSQILGLIEQSAKGTAPDPAGVRRYINDLRTLQINGERLTDNDTSRLLAALCDTPFMQQLPGVIGGDPYALMRDIEAALKKTPPDKAAAKKLIADLHSLLADARMKLQPDEVKRHLKTLRNAKLFDELSWMSDRFAARDPDLIGTVTTSYAQGLIDSGRLVAGIEMLHAAEDLKVLSADEAKDAAGILGRGHKQIYVNHVKTASDALALRDSFGGQLCKAIECYGRHYDPQRPGENSYQGINYIALLKRAQNDRIKTEVKGDPDTLAKNIIEALEPKAVPDADDPWLLATVGEAYLAIGRFDKAAEFFGLYAKHPRVDAFQLNGTIRQLEEVWQLKAGAQGAEAILTNLKSALAQKDSGFVSLTGEERRAIAKAGTVEFQSCFETVTTGGKFINFGFLKRIVACGASVAAIQIKLGQAGRTVGTGFLVKGSDFSPTLSGDKSYILTNAHVMWDHTRNQGIEDKAISPDVARVVFENDQIDGRTDVYGCTVIWQSPSSLLDATLIELDRRVDHTVPLELAPSNTLLSVASETSKGTKLAVLGHPQGGSLSIGVLGTIEEMQGTLVDRGPRANTEDPIFLRYMTPTEPGNSGSPVFEAEGWRVVGLHHVGFVEGTRGLAKLGGKAGEQLANEGIWIESIRTAVKNELSPAPQRNERRKWWG
jgi:Trypsin-like peptidase domain